MSVVSFFVLLGVIEASALHWDCFVNSSTRQRWTLPGVRTETKRLRPPTGNWRVDLCGTMSFVSSICRINHPRLSWLSRVRVGARQRKWAASDRNLSLIESSHSHRHPSSVFSHDYVTPWHESEALSSLNDTTWVFQGLPFTSGVSPWRRTWFESFTSET